MRYDVTFAAGTKGLRLLHSKDFPWPPCGRISLTASPGSQVQTMNYSAIVFDTAPTGHTLRLLQFPTTLEKGLSKLMGLRGMLGGLMEQVSALMGAGLGGMQEGLLGKLEELKVRTPPSSGHDNYILMSPTSSVRVLLSCSKPQRMAPAAVNAHREH